MDSLGRLLLRFVLVPLGYFVAVVVATLVIVLGSWKLGAAAAHPDTQAFAIFGFVFAAPVLLIMLLSLMWLPAAIGILISEAFAIRSFMFHAGNGAVSAFIGWSLFGYVDDTRIPLNEPLPVLAAGLAAGLAYWLIAGASAGFWKPLFRRPAGAALRRIRPHIRRKSVRKSAVGCVPTQRRRERAPPPARFSWTQHREPRYARSEAPVAASPY